MTSKWEAMKDMHRETLEALKKAEAVLEILWKRRECRSFCDVARKFDRIEHQSEKIVWDIFEAGEAFKGEAGLLDDIVIYVEFLLLCEQHILDQSNPKHTRC